MLQEEYQSYLYSINNARTFWLVFLACISLDLFRICKKLFGPLSVYIVYYSNISNIKSHEKPSPSNWPTISLFLPSLKWSFTVIFLICPCSANSTISVIAGLVKLVPENIHHLKRTLYFWNFCFLHIYLIFILYYRFLLAVHHLLINGSTERLFYNYLIIPLLFSFLSDIRAWYKILQTILKLFT